MSDAAQVIAQINNLKRSIQNLKELSIDDGLKIYEELIKLPDETLHSMLDTRDVNNIQHVAQVFNFIQRCELKEKEYHLKRAEIAREKIQELREKIKSEGKIPNQTNIPGVGNYL